MSLDGKKKTLIISISEYDHLPTLDFCRKDGEEVSKMLYSKNFDISESCKLIGRVDYIKMHDAIINFFHFKNTNTEDTLLFYYSGHGVPDINFNVYLASSETDSDVPNLRGFSFDEFTNMIQQSTAKRIVAILDCCHSGAARTSKGSQEDEAKMVTKLIDDKSNIFKQGEGRCILSSSLGTQKAYELKELGHSIFTYYLLEGLKGNCVDDIGNVTAYSLGTYLHDTIVNLPEKIRPNQRPVIKLEGGGNIILASYPKLAKIKNQKQLDFESQLMFYRSLKKYLDQSYRKFVEQCIKRDELISLLERNHNLTQYNTYEELFKNLYPKMNAEEIGKFILIHKITGDLKMYNSLMLELLEKNKKNLNEIHELQDLYEHLEWWLSKYEFASNQPDMALIYVGVTDQKPFPRTVDNIIKNKLAEFEKL